MERYMDLREVAHHSGPRAFGKTSKRAARGRPTIQTPILAWWGWLKGWPGRDRTLIQSPDLKEYDPVFSQQFINLYLFFISIFCFIDS